MAWSDDYLEPSSQPEYTDSLAPFAGRKAIFERIQQYLIDPSDRHALLFIGRQSIGRSTLLLQCQYVLGENIIGCYLPLASAQL